MIVVEMLNVLECEKLDDSRCHLVDVLNGSVIKNGQIAGRVSSESNSCARNRVPKDLGDAIDQYNRP